MGGGNWQGLLLNPAWS